MEEARLVLNVEVDEDLPLVAIDEPQIRQALLNLLRNAREAMAGGGRASIEATGDGDGVRIRVRDEGPGIPPASRDRIFDIFYTTKERGSGLGLPLTQQIVVAHGGRIRCEAGAGGGTTFEMWLPAAARASAPSSPATSAASGTPAASTPPLTVNGRPNDAFED
jgi:signal transduction histidine kinase